MPPWRLDCVELSYPPVRSTAAGVVVKVSAMLALMKAKLIYHRVLAMSIAV
jgi:hypothetical protein